MIRQDYIMRLIEQLVKVLAKVLFNKSTGEYNSALDSIDNAMDTLVGLDHYFINNFTADDIKTLLKKANDESGFDIKCIITAKLIKEKTDILKINGSPESECISNYQKALSLYLEGIMNIDKTEIDLNNYYSDIKELAEILKDNINPDLKEKLDKL